MKTLATLALTVLLSQVGFSQNQKVTINYPTRSGASWPLYIAKEGGYYAKYGLDVNIIFGVHPSGVEEFSCGALNDENSRLSVAPGDKNGSDPQSLVRQLYTSPTPNGGYLQVTAGAELVIEHFDSRGKRLYRAVK